MVSRISSEPPGARECKEILREGMIRSFSDGGQSAQRHQEVLVVPQARTVCENAGEKKKKENGFI